MAPSEEQGTAGEDTAAGFKGAAEDDWNAIAAGLRERRLNAEKKAKQMARDDNKDNDIDDDDLYEERRRYSWCGRKCVIYTAAFLVSFLLVGCWQLYAWFNPMPVSCSLELIRPQKFKVDVTDFFAPRVSAALQLVLQLRNGNMLRSMLLEQCKLTVFDDETGLRLGSAQQGSLVLSPYSTTQVTVALNHLAGALPPPEQRRLAATFLAKKALLLTIVATASSRIPKKGTAPMSVASNSSRRVDLSSLAKEPFFQRQYLPSVDETPPVQEAP